MDRSIRVVQCSNVDKPPSYQTQLTRFFEINISPFPSRIYIFTETHDVKYLLDFSKLSAATILRYT